MNKYSKPPLTSRQADFLNSYTTLVDLAWLIRGKRNQTTVHNMCSPCDQKYGVGTNYGSCLFTVISTL